MASECKLCDGALQVFAGCDDIGDPCTEPRPACLSVPATDEIRAVAREWWGGNPWAKPNNVISLDMSPWHSDEVVSTEEAWGNANVVHGRRCILPIYLPAGFDLGVRVLGARRRDGHTDVWRLLTYWNLHTFYNCFRILDKYDADWDHESWAVSRDVKRMLAVKLALETT